MEHEHINTPPAHLTREPVPVAWMIRFKYMSDMFDRISQVPGDVVECGIGEGTTFAMLAYLIGRDRSDHHRTLRGFDSFEGFPEPSEKDVSWRDPQAGEWKFSEDVVRSHLESVGISSKFPQLRTKLTKGFFGDSLPKEEYYPVAFLHADGDLYDSYKDVLENFYPRVSSGGIVLFDEYREFKPEHDQEKWPGATMAIDEYFGPLGLAPTLHEETGKYFIEKP